MQAPFETFVQVRYAETDAMGIVHHSRYFVWLELARIEWLKTLGIDYKDMERQGFFIPVVLVDLQYKAPTYFDDRLKIVLYPPQDCERVRFTLNYQIFRDTLCVAKGFTVHAFLNAQRQLIKPPQFFLQKVQVVAGDKS